MASREDCLDEIARKTGRSRKDVEDLLEQIALRKPTPTNTTAWAPMRPIPRRATKRSKEIYERAALDQRAAVLDGRKAIARQRYYEIRRRRSPACRSATSSRRGSRRRPRAWRSRPSSSASTCRSSKAAIRWTRNSSRLRRRLVGGLSRDLEDAGLLKIFASRLIEDKWTDELFQLNRGEYGKPGLTKDAQALTIAKTIQKWQRAAMAGAQP